MDSDPRSTMEHTSSPQECTSDMQKAVAPVDDTSSVQPDSTQSQDPPEPPKFISLDNIHYETGQFETDLSVYEDDDTDDTDGVGWHGSVSGDSDASENDSENVDGLESNSGYATKDTDSEQSDVSEDDGQRDEDNQDDRERNEDVKDDGETGHSVVDNESDDGSMTTDVSDDTDADVDDEDEDEGDKSVM